MKEEDIPIQEISEQKKNGMDFEQKTRPIQQPFPESHYLTLKRRIQIKMQKVFKQFSFSSLTFYMFLLNCLIWISSHIIYYWGGISDWDCLQYLFFAKYQPSITYQYQFWRLLLSSIMFKNAIQFYFNNFSLNMLGYEVEKESKLKLLTIFYGGILAGHMLSCCLSNPTQLTVGTSCGTIAMLPIQVFKFSKLRKKSPIQARSRRNFLIFNIVSNFFLNILSIFHLVEVDWISHLGCLVAGFFFLLIYELENSQDPPKEIWEKQDSRKGIKKIVKFVSIILLFTFYVLMGIIIWSYLPSRGIGKDGMEQIYFLCKFNQTQL